MRSRRSGLVLDAAILLVVLLALALGAVRYLDVPSETVAILQTLGPFVVIALTLLVALVALLRRWRVLVPTVAAALVAWWVAAPAFFAHTVPDEEPDLSVVSVNLRFGQARAEQVMDAVRARQADVVILVEVTPEALARLDELGLSRRMPYQAGEAKEGVAGTLIASTRELTDIVEDRGSFARGWSRQPEASIDVNGIMLRLKAVHPNAPYAGQIQTWREGLRELGAWRDQLPPDTPLLMGGDFNSDFGHPGFRAVADGMSEAHRSAGQGWVRTWPVVGHRVPPFVQLDHLLSRGLHVIDAGTTYINGTDHGLIWATYSLA